jgi:hypothetical protein
VKTQEGLGIYNYSLDPRDKMKNGHDGASPAYYYTSYPGYEKENYKGDGRKYFKRQYAKGRRKMNKEIEVLVEA